MKLERVRPNMAIPINHLVLKNMSEIWYSILSYKDPKFRSFMMDDREMFVEKTKFFYYVIGFKDENF